MSETKITSKKTEEISGLKPTKIFQWLGIIVLVYCLITAVSLIGSGFKLTAGDQAKALFTFATNPFAGLIVGILATALIQSSSTVTSIIVGLVAGGLPVMMAVPMIMGSNIGTTITNTLVSLGHINDKDEFEKAFSAATVHDFFNLLCVLIFLPLEITLHPLEKTAFWVSNFFLGGNSTNIDRFNFIQIATAPLVNLFNRLSQIFPNPFDGIGLIVIGIILIFSSIFYLGKLLKLLMVGEAKVLLRQAIGRAPLIGIFSGTIVTILVQSSSTTTSLIIPLAGTGLLTLEEVYPFTLGANIGTCITALIAATAVTENHLAALQIAMVHLLYNIFGVTIIYGIPFLRNLPLLGAKTLATIASKRNYLAFIYILTVFFLVPSLFLGITSINP
ncbi:Na+/Picotransporter [Rippkaea orientalis PCC 8801]|uniref:Na+/Picotransporter n=1 Tax=Rippkaea orientalis (strain PCC 8801 / RF-1) TaxID=41431 RepID=B7JUM0_RIPO1|nr:Na/Pi symporter [Rippkaea orientalis]ACK65564.1 Na+/Picotransporter [Rippkaea orientalis PCC 8801]